MTQNHGKSVIFSAPSGAGKTTIVKRLLERIPELAFSVSATSRDRRGDEVDGKDYYFLGPEEFKKRIQNEQFLEWEEVYTDNFYGTLLSELDRIWDQGKTVIFDVDVVGGLRIKKKFGDRALAFFVMPPDMETLEKRLRGRETETEEKIQMRLAKAGQELGRSEEFDIVLVNDDLDTAVANAEKKVREFIGA